MVHDSLTLGPDPDLDLPWPAEGGGSLAPSLDGLERVAARRAAAGPRPEVLAPCL